MSSPIAPLSKLLIGIRPLVLEESETRRRYADQRTATRRGRLHESTITRILTHRKPRTLRAPGIQRLLVGALPASYPLQQIEDQIFDRIGYGLTITRSCVLRVRPNVQVERQRDEAALLLKMCEHFDDAS